jgi:hypothetical protein
MDTTIALYMYRYKTWISLIYFSLWMFIRYYEWVGNKNVNKEANSYIEVN